LRRVKMIKVHNIELFLSEQYFQRRHHGGRAVCRITCGSSEYQTTDLSHRCANPAMMFDYVNGGAENTIDTCSSQGGTAVNSQYGRWQGCIELTQQPQGSQATTRSSR
jgi:hypothetical protein